MFNSNKTKTMKKTKFLAIYMMAAMCSFGLAACSDSDDEGYNGTTGVITDEDGVQVRVLRAGGYDFSYDEEGQLASAGDYDVSQNPFTLTDNDDDETDITTISRNGKGYITKMTRKVTDAWGDDDWEEYTDTYSFSYDGSGHLTKISCNESGTECEDGEKENYSGNGTWALTWSNNKLTRIYGEVDGYTEEITYEYNDDAYENPSHQFALSYWGDVGIACHQELAALGMFGMGGDYLPTSSTYTWTDEPYEGSYTINYSYGFYSDGLLNYERHGSTYYYYGYEGIEDDEDEEVKAQRSAASQNQNETRRHSFFLRHHRK